MVVYNHAHEAFIMLSDPSTQYRKSHQASWAQSFQGRLQTWIRQEIIDEDPYDDEKLIAQALYEQLQQLELEQALPLEQTTSSVKPEPVLSCSTLR
jgi:hypothetical protein